MISVFVRSESHMLREKITSRIKKLLKNHFLAPGHLKLLLNVQVCMNKNIDIVNNKVVFEILLPQKCIFR